MATTYLDQKRRIRTALFYYLRITLDQLEPWCGFWNDKQNSLMPTTREDLERRLTDLTTFNTVSVNRVAGAGGRMERWLRSREGSEMLLKWSRKDQDGDTTHLTERWEYQQAIFDGSLLRAGTEEVIQVLAEGYKPLLRYLVDWFKDNSVDLESSSTGIMLVTRMDTLEKILQDLRKHLKRLEKELEAGGRVGDSLDVERTMAEAFGFIRSTDEELESRSVLPA